jgi:hypothetical protein
MVTFSILHVLGLDPLMVWLDGFGLFKVRVEEAENLEEVQR